MSEWQETDVGLIPADWGIIRFQEILSIPLRNGVNKPSKVRGIGNYKMVNMNEIFAHDVIYDIPMEFVELDKNEKETSLLEKFDLLFARQSLVLEGAGKCSIYLGDNEKICFEGHLIRARLDSKKSNPKFYYYFFSSDYGKRFIRTITEQAVVAGIRGSDLKELQIPYPPQKEQNEVAAILSCLDRKIENLRKQNETLERIAQTLFKHWFVDFEFPNEDGKPYKSSGGAMVRSQLGEIPADWHVGKLGDLFVLNYGKSLTLETRVSGRYPVVGSSGIVGSHQEYLVNAPGIVIGRKGTIGKVIWLAENFYPIDTTFYIEDIFGCTGLYFYYFLLKRQDFQRLTSDSAVPGLNRDMAYSVEIVIPKIVHINRFNTLVKSIFNKIHLNQRQIQTLTKTRDMLLPQLMSGKLRVGDSVCKN